MNLTKFLAICCFVLLILSIWLTYKVDVCHKDTKIVISPINVDSITSEMENLKTINESQLQLISDLENRAKKFENKYNEYKKIKQTPAIEDTSDLYRNLTEFSSD